MKLCAFQIQILFAKPSHCNFDPLDDDRRMRTFSLCHTHTHVTVLTADMQNEEKNEPKKRIAKEKK